jgi:hypothetical protein
MKKRKDPHAVALGRKGAAARMVKMTHAERSKVARKAIAARWAKKKGNKA